MMGDYVSIYQTSEMIRVCSKTVSSVVLGGGGGMKTQSNCQIFRTLCCSGFNQNRSSKIRNILFRGFLCRIIISHNFGEVVIKSCHPLISICLKNSDLMGLDSVHSSASVTKGVANISQ